MALVRSLLDRGSYPFRSGLSPFLSAALVLLSLGEASAYTLAETRGIGARAMAMGGAFTGVADDPSANYYNPAGMIQIDDHRSQMEYVMVFPRVRLNRGAGPGEVYLDKPAKSPMLSIVMDLSRHWKISRRLRFGFSGYFPQNFKSAGQIRYGTQYDPYYPLYGDSSADQVLCAWVNAALEIFPWLYAGAGFSFGTHASDVTLSMAIDPANLQNVIERSRVVWKMTTEMDPVFGILIKPLPRVRVGFTFRDSSKLIFAGGLKVEALLYDRSRDQAVPFAFPGFPILVPIHSHWRPVQYALGASYQLLSNLLVAFDLTYYDWRAYKDEMEKPLNPRMKAVWVPRFGLEYYPRPELALRAGYGFKPSPLEQQVGTWVNYLDNDTHVFSGGAGLYVNPNNWFKHPLGLSFYYQLSYLVPRTFQNVHPDGLLLRSSGYVQSVGGGIQMGF